MSGQGCPERQRRERWRQADRERGRETGTAEARGEEQAPGSGGLAAWHSAACQPHPGQPGPSSSLRRESPTSQLQDRQAEGWWASLSQGREEPPLGRPHRHTQSRTQAPGPQLDTHTNPHAGTQPPGAPCFVFSSHSAWGLHLTPPISQVAPQIPCPLSLQPASGV